MMSSSSSPSASRSPSPGEVEKSPRSQQAEENAEAPVSPKPPPTATTTGQVMASTGGATYMPPAKLRQLQQQSTDKTSEAYQRLAWEALKKTIHGLIVNKVNTGNIDQVVRQLFRENLMRGRGILCRSILVAQAASPTYTPVYAALIAVINTRFPRTGELILKRLIMDFKANYRRKNKERCLTSGRFLAHLVNQKVAHEIIILEVIALLLEQRTNASVEIAIGILKECGAYLTKVSPKIMVGLFEQMRAALMDPEIEQRVQYMIEVLFQIRREGYKDYPIVQTELDLVNEDDQVTHFLLLEDTHDVEEQLNVFRFDPKYEENEQKYQDVVKVLLEGGEDSGSGSSDSGEGSSDSEDEEEAAAEEGKTTIVDNTETDLINFRRTVYLTIRSSITVDETAHKLLKLKLQPGQEYELSSMILDCCAQLRAYDRKYGYLAQRFCAINRVYVENYERIFVEQYKIMHRLDTVKVRNIANLFAHLLNFDAISWGVLHVVRLTEEDTTSSGRIFLKILFQELCQFLSLPKVNERLHDPTLQCFFEGIFPKDHPKNTRFAINFFTAIGLGGLTVELRNFLKNATAAAAASDKSDSEEEDTDAESSSSSESSSESSFEEEAPKAKKHKEDKSRHLSKHKEAQSKSRRSKKEHSSSSADRQKKASSRHKRVSPSPEQRRNTVTRRQRGSPSPQNNDKTSKSGRHRERSSSSDGRNKSSKPTTRRDNRSGRYDDRRMASKKTERRASPSSSRQRRRRSPSFEEKSRKSSRR